MQGKTRPLDIYSVVAAVAEPRDPSRDTYLAVYSRAQAAYRAGSFADAVPLFQNCVDHWPEDKLASIYVARCLALMKNPPSGEWSGVHVATHK